MNKIICKRIILELPETLEEGNAKNICDKPYRIERVDENDKIIWFGYNKNWRFEDNKWTVLMNGKFKPCDVPEYEKIYLKLIK